MKIEKLFDRNQILVFALTHSYLIFINQLDFIVKIIVKINQCAYYMQHFTWNFLFAYRFSETCTAIAKNNDILCNTSASSCYF